MRVLVVLAQLPVLDGLAAGKCALGLVRGLQEHGIETTVVAPRLAGRDEMTMSLDLHVELAGVRQLSAWQERWRRVRAPRGHLGTGEFDRRVRELAAKADVLHLDEVDAAAAGRSLAIPTVVHLHYLVGRDRGMGPIWSSAARDWLEHRAAERQAVRRTPWLVANSPEIATALRAMDRDSDVTVVPLALDPAGYAAPARLDEPVVGLIGTGYWPPTADSLRRLVTRVWPRVRTLVPGAKLHIAGRGIEPSRFGSAATGNGIEWLGPVDSASDFVRGLGVMLYPVGRGSGTKVKVLEAMALGVPVVTTTAGAEGVVDHAGVIVRDDDDGLAEATARLLRAYDLRVGSGRAARVSFTTNHTPAAATRPLVELYERILR